MKFVDKIETHTWNKLCLYVDKQEFFYEEK